MAKASITYTFNYEDDGIGGEMQYCQNNVDDINSWLWFITEATRAAGFTHIGRLTAVTDDGEEVSSTF